MEYRTLQYVADCCGGELLDAPPELTVTQVRTDSRHIEAGDLFVALAGERFDGHDYVHEATQRGAAALMLERDKVPPDTDHRAVIAVRHSRQALGRLAARYRRDFDLPCIAVGGSNGKTTTKELLACVLSQKFHTLKSEASFNND